MSIEGFNGEESYYPHPTSNKHKGDVMERRFEYQELGGKHGIFEGNLLVAVVGECFARPESAGDVAREMARVWNEHDALVEQRVELIATLQRVRGMLAYVRELNRLDLVKQQTEQGIIQIDDALATVEQGGES